MTDVSNLCEAARSARVTDLSHMLEEHMPHYPTHAKFFHNLWGSYWHGDRALRYRLVVHEHSGAHVDAPAHFISDAKPEAHVTIEQVPAARLLGRGVHLNCRGFLEDDYVPRSFVTEWETQHGELRTGDIVLFDFGWSAYWGLRPNHQRYVADWPGVSKEAAEYLLEKRVAALGENSIYPLVLEKQVLVIENLANLDQLPDFFLFPALPLKIRRSSG